MKKLVLFFAVAAAVSFAACTGNKATEENVACGCDSAAACAQACETCACEVEEVKCDSCTTPCDSCTVAPCDSCANTEVVAE